MIGYQVNSSEKKYIFSIVTIYGVDCVVRYSIFYMVR